jgi:mono/diheme cytochrome c family protein
VKALIATIVGATIGASVGAATHPVIVRHRQVEFVPYAQYVYPSLPAYSVGMQQQLANPEVLERIARALERIADRGGNGELGELPPEPEYVGLVRTNCASCHGVTPKGNKLSFFDSTGRLKEPTPEVLGSIIAQVSSGTMPKGGTMAPADRLKLIAGFTTSEPTKGKTP